MKLVIGIVGEIGSGKGTFAAFVTEVLGPRRAARVRFSDVLRDTLTLWNLPHSREHLQALPVAMSTAFGADALTRAVQKRIEDQRADVILIDGVRWPSDVSLIRSFPRNLLVYITAEPQVRYERLKARNENAGEAAATFERFLTEGRAENERYIPRLGATADVRIVNAGSRDDLHRQAHAFCTAHLAEYLERQRARVPPA